jgi:hypothetical protein
MLYQLARAFVLHASVAVVGVHQDVGVDEILGICWLHVVTLIVRVLVVCVLIKESSSQRPSLGTIIGRT